jgi:potassium/hydrogen antiporter
MISILHQLLGTATGATEVIDAGQYILTAFSDITIILAAALIAERLSNILKVPDVILFLLAGVVLSPTVPFWVPIREASIANQLVVTFGASYILFQGGMGLNLKTIIRYGRVIALLAIPGVIISAVLVGIAGRLIFPALPLAAALLLGVILSPTDPATLIPILQKIRLKERLEVVIESESAFNDTTGAILFISVVAFIQGGQVSLVSAVGGFLAQLLIGGAVGAGFGLLAGFLVSERAVGFFRASADILTVPIAIGAYTLSQYLGGSGFLAAFLAGVFLRNTREILPRRIGPEQGAKLEIFSENLALISRMMIFVILGSQIDFLSVRQYLLPGLLLLAVFIFISRPAVVFSCFGLDRKALWTGKEKIFLSWVRETGVMPAALAGSLATISLGFPGQMQTIYDDFVQAMVFLAILVTLLVQALSTPWLARRLSLVRSEGEEAVSSEQ